MIFRFFSITGKCREIILVDYCSTGWYLRYHQHAEFSDRRGEPVLRIWIEENGCFFPDGLSQAFEELWIGIHNGHLSGEQSRNRLDRFAEWLDLLNKDRRRKPG